MKTWEKILVGAAAIGTVGFVGYEYYQSKKPRQKVPATQFFLSQIPQGQGPAGATYGDLSVWNADQGAPANAPATKPHTFLASLQVAQPGEAGFLGLMATWLPVQILGGNRVFFCVTPAATTQAGLAFYKLYVNDPSPPIDAIEIVNG